MIELYIIREIGDGFIGLMPRPRSGDLLEHDMAKLAENGAGVLVSLLEAQEIEQLGLQNEASVASQLGIEYISHPVPDRGVPLDDTSFTALAIDLKKRVMRGHGVVVHCWGGIGRSGLLVATVLNALGAAPGQAFAEVSDIRGVAVPETEEQKLWLHRNHRHAE